ncbi:MAG: ferredoxin--NADP reductase [Alkalispirochaeta sp.]
MIATGTAAVVREIRWLTDSTFVLTFDRNGIDFTPGQYLSVGIPGSIHMREYSVYAPVGGEAVAILVKIVDGGLVSHALAALAPGDTVIVDGPFGFFTVDEDWREHRFRFIATGTGISPFHSIVGSCPGIDYQLIHGVRYPHEGYDLDRYDPDRVIRCITRAGGDEARADTDRGAGNGGGSTRADTGDDGFPRFPGRVTDYLRSTTIDVDARYYLCGNCDMIYEAFDILQDAGVPHSRLFAEVYF